LFLILPVLLLFLRARWRARLDALKTFGNMELVGKLVEGIDRDKQIGKQVLIGVGVFFLILALLRPQFGTRTKEVKRAGQDIVIALDLSRSMLAEDFTPNRLEKAMQEIKSFMKLLEGDRIGLVVFSGEAQILCPLTLDYGAASLFLEEVNTDWLPTPGTNLTDAIDVATKAFVTEEQGFKNIVLITDGEGHEGDPVEAAKKAAEQGITIYAIGIGQPEGVPIPIEDDSGSVTYVRDSKGERVTTKLDIDTLQQIAAVTGGRWHQATGGQLELREIYEEIREQEDKELTSTITTIYEDRYQIPLLIGFAILLIEVCLSDRKKKKNRYAAREEALDYV
ncbi:MAG: VWA domain-containing protein, partial [Candidatus Omnitrophica bacterium]|nr:VWA domain-containing protein [Candidatus Omnitrophota bacterium]